MEEGLLTAANHGVHLLQVQASKQEGTQKRHPDLSDLLLVPPQWPVSARNQPARQLGSYRVGSYIGVQSWVESG